MNIYTAEDKEYLFVSTSFNGGHSTSLRLDSLAFWPLGAAEQLVDTTSTYYHLIKFIE